MKKAGFTLVEVMIVVAIIAILALAAIASLGDAIKKSKDGRVISLAGSLRSGVGAYLDGEKEKIYPEKISDIKRYLTPQMEKVVGDGDLEVSDTDNITSYESEAGTSEKMGVVSMGKIGGKFEGKNNIVELFYDNETGNIVIDGAGATSEKDVKEYKDTKKRYWKEY